MKTAFSVWDNRIAPVKGGWDMTWTPCPDVIRSGKETWKGREA